MRKKLLLAAILLLAGLTVWFLTPEKSSPSNSSLQQPPTSQPDANLTQEASQTVYRAVDFSPVNPAYRFSGSLPLGWQVEYVAGTEAVNIFDPNFPGGDNLEKSQIFIRNFEADKFLTLGTVEVLSQEAITVSGHAAVSYEIEKKPGVADFPNQPSWRSRRHKLVDVRFADTAKSVFFVFAYSPALSEQDFSRFLWSLAFHNDQASFLAPLSQASERVTKKPFGIKISPDDSPVSPERFSGYHTGVDFEILPSEENQEVPISAVCGGEISQRRAVSGYGGAVVQKCQLKGQTVWVLYGHLDLNSVAAKTGEYLWPGQFLGNLGQGFSEETDGERKHLHLGMNFGLSALIAGYAKTEQELAKWTDPIQLWRRQ